MANYDFKAAAAAAQEAVYIPPKYHLRRWTSKTSDERMRDDLAKYFGEEKYGPDNAADVLNERFSPMHKVKLMFCIRVFTIEKTATEQGLHYFKPFQQRIFPDHIISRTETN